MEFIQKCMRCGNNMFFETEELVPCKICDMPTEIVIVTEENRSTLPMATHMNFPNGIMPEDYAQKASYEALQGSTDSNI